MMIQENEVYTPQEIMSILKISDSTFRRLVRGGILNATKVGGQYRILGRQVLEMLSPGLSRNIGQNYKKAVKN